MCRDEVMLEMEAASISQLIPEPLGTGKQGRDGPLKQGREAGLCYFSAVI